MGSESRPEEETHVRLAAIALVAALLSALPALAGPVPHGPDTDSDGYPDYADNCDLVANPGQQDSDSDGYGNACDCDYDNDNACVFSDFLTFGANYNQAVPPCPAVVDQNSDLTCGFSDFLLFGAGYNQPPGSSCSNAHLKGIPCPGPLGP